MRARIVSRLSFSIKRWIGIAVGIVVVVSPGVLYGPLSRAQSPGTVPAASTAAPEFEAATIKPVRESSPGRLQDRTDGRRYTTRYTTLKDLLMMAYGLDPRQITDRKSVV